MILPDHEIHALCLNGMVEPYDRILLNPASLDVRLGNQVLLESVASSRMIPLDIGKYNKYHPYELVPGQFILAHTIETFRLPSDIAAQFMLKSSRAREGFEHLLAGYCDPGWHGSVLTLEIKNARQLQKIGIYPGLRIGQMVFTRMASTPTQDYSKTGNYNNHNTVMQSIHETLDK